VRKIFEEPSYIIMSYHISYHIIICTTQTISPSFTAGVAGRPRA